MAHNELRHFGVKGMKWGVRKTPEQHAKLQAKANATAEKVRAIAKNVHTDSAGNAYMRAGDVSKANRLVKQHQKQTAKAEKYKRVMDKAQKTPYRNVNQRESRFSFKNVAGGLAVGAAGVAIARLISPTVDIFGKKMGESVKSGLATSAAKREAKKHFASDAAEFAKRRAAAQATNTAANYAKENFAPW